PDRESAERDVMTAAHRLRDQGCSVLFFDISNRPSPRAQRLSAELGALYQPLPYADSAAVSKKVKQAVMGS
ncbi:MAG: magnesium chelatase ATPase subunit D, partial [Pseudomonadota bacterium]